MEKIKTDRLILRKPKRSDIELLLPLLSDDKIEEYVPGLSYKTIDKIKDFIKFYIKKTDYKNDFCLLIQDLKTKEILGIIDAYIYCSNKYTIGISYGLKESARGKSIILEALKSFLTYLHINSNAKYAEFSIREDNTSSLRVMEKLNIPSTGKSGNYIYYRLSLKEKPSF